MTFDENNFDEPGSDAPLPEESNNNRTFLIAVGILGGIILISIACLVGVYLFGMRNKGTAAPAAVDATATASAANSIISQALTATASAAILPTETLTPSPVPTAVVSVPTTTNTPDPAMMTSAAVAAAPGDAGTQIAATVTVGAALTKAAEAQKTIIPTSTALAALPNGGFADDIGLPGFVVMGLAFVIVILLARRLRTAPVR